MDCALLIHEFDGESSSSFYEVEDGVALCKTEGSNVEGLYFNLCENHNVDQGEPFSYHFHLLINDIFSHHESVFDIRGHYSIISKLCNIVAICLSYPLGMCRMILSEDNFKTAWVPSEIVYGGIYGGEELGVLRANPDDIKFGKDGSIFFLRLPDGYTQKV